MNSSFTFKSSLAYSLVIISLAMTGFVKKSFAAMLVTQDFESDITPFIEWSTYKSTASGTNVRSNYSYSGGFYAWRMDKSGIGTEFNLNELVVRISTISAYVSLSLSFYTREYSDVQNTFPSDNYSFAGHYNADGIAVSSNNVNWISIWQYPWSLTSWTQYIIDISSSLIPFSGNIYIKFQQYGQYSFENAGIMWDDISIEGISTDSYEEDNIFGQAKEIVISTSTTSQERTICPANDNDYVYFSGVSGNVYKFFTTGNLDTYCYIYNQAQGYVTEFNNDGSNTNFSSTWTCVTTGIYFLRILENGQNASGAYTLHYSYEEPDSYELDNTFAAASSMTVTALLQSQSRTIFPAADNDYIKFVAHKGAYTFYTEGNVDTYGYIYNYAQGYLTYDDNGTGDGKNFQLIWSCTSPSTYYLRIFEYGNVNTGPYTLHYSYEPPDSYEDDDSYATPSSMTVTTSLQSQSRSIIPAVDYDYIKFVANKGVYTFYTAGNVDTYATIYNYNQTYLTYDDNSMGDSKNFRLTWSCTSPSTYYLQISENGNNSSGAYVLYYTYDPVDIYEPDDLFAAPSSMTVTTSPQSQSRNIIPNTDYDYIKFYATVGNIYTFYTTGTLDTFCYLYNASQSYLAYDNNSYDGTANFLINWKCSTSGYYYLQIYENGFNASGSYTLYYSYYTGDAYEPDNSFTQYTSITPGSSESSQSRTINPVGDNDYIYFYANLGYNYIFYSSGTVDTYAYIYNNSQTLQTSNNNNGTDINFRITWTCAAAGYYFLKICENGNDATGSYTFYYKYLNLSSDSYENDNSFSYAKTITPDSYYTSQDRTIYSTGDMDYIKFYGSQDRIYSFYTTGDLDTVGTLYDAAYSQLTTDDNSYGVGNNFKITWTCPANAYYYLKINSKNTSTGFYTVYYKYSTITDTVADNPKLREENVISFPQPYNPQNGGSMNITYLVPAGDSTLTINIYDMTGYLVKKIYTAETTSSGPKSFSWNGRNESGQLVVPGIYLVHFRTETVNVMKRVGIFYK